MCMLTYLPAGILPNRDRLKNGTVSNRDGHGWAIVVMGDDGTGSHIVTGHSMNADAAIEAFTLTREKHPEGPALFHSRFTTGGWVNESNCHPYVVNGDPRTVLAHNGVLPYSLKQPEDDKRSDTRYFAEVKGRHLYPGSYPGTAFNLNSKRGRRRLRDWLGNPNKFVILTVDPTFRHNAYVINEQQGVWEDDGCWYSNSGYKEKTYGIGTRAYVGSGWGWSSDAAYGYGGSYDGKRYAVDSGDDYSGNVWSRLADATQPDRIDKGNRPPLADTRRNRACKACGSYGIDLQWRYCHNCGTCTDCWGDALAEDDDRQYGCECLWPFGTHPGRKARLEKAFGVTNTLGPRPEDLGPDDGDSPPADDAVEGALARLASYAKPGDCVWEDCKLPAGTCDGYKCWEAVPPAPAQSPRAITAAPDTEGA